LEEADEEQLWIANRYISEPTGDGRCTWIPTLKVFLDDGQTKEINTNERKAEVISKSFFPKKPLTNLVP
jgi:hypothetical protein